MFLNYRNFLSFSFCLTGSVFDNFIVVLISRPVVNSESNDDTALVFIFPLVSFTVSGVLISSLPYDRLFLHQFCRAKRPSRSPGGHLSVHYFARYLFDSE